MDICFAAFQVVELLVPEQPVPIQHYLRQPHRIVNALAASSCIEPLNEELFRLKMRPLTFMMLSLQPTVDLHVWSEPDGTVQVRSRACEIRGIEYLNQRFTLHLVGQLQPCVVNGTVYLKGRADLKMSVELPPALRLTPKAFLEATGNGLLKSVLVTIKQRLMYHLLLDYRKWAVSSPEEAKFQPSALSNPIA